MTVAFNQNGTDYRAILHGEDITFQVDARMPWESRPDWRFAGVGRFVGGEIVDCTHVGPKQIIADLEADFSGGVA